MTIRRNSSFNSRRSLLAPGVFWLFAAVCALCAAPCAKSQAWKPLGPDGGDARSLASDPSRPGVVYLGTTDGHIFGSQDGGRHWQLLGLAGDSHEAIVTAIVVDSRHAGTLFAATWTREARGEGGGIYRSVDGGRTWSVAGLSGHAVRALVAAPSDPDSLVAGALDGVFLSRDGGRNWEAITPVGDPELRNFDSLAFDPRSPEVIYAGTFHLPWKTIDGGAHWFPIHEGMIDDSDVLSLAVNPADPEQIFASACSGIYASADAGSHWRKIQGIPDSSKRTLVIRFDPAAPGTLYAGTTDGLWKSTESGARWRRVSPSDWVINSLVVLASRGEPDASRVLIGTEQQGVLAGSSATDRFEPANDGFQHRHIVALTADRENPNRLAAVLANATDPVVGTDDGGATWFPLGSGLETASVRRVYSTPEGWWAAASSGGLLRLDAKSGEWVRTGVVVDGALAPVAASSVPGRRRTLPPVPAPFRATVNDLDFSDATWFAATEEGLFASADAGASWSPVPFSSAALPVGSVRVSADGGTIRIVSSHGMVFSNDAGRSWKWHDLPLDSYGALRLETVDDATLLATSPTGLYISRDAGATWTKAQSGLPASPIADVLVRRDFWAVSVEKGGLYVSRDRGVNWSRIENPAGAADSGSFQVLSESAAADRIYAGSVNESLYLLDLSRPLILANRISASH